MKTNVKRVLAVIIAFAIGLLLSSKIVAQESNQIQRMEATIAQLQAELDQLKSQRLAPNETAWQSGLSEPLIESLPADNLIAPGYDAREIIQAPEFELPQPAIKPQFGVPPASIAPTLVEQPLIEVPQINAIPTAPPFVAPSPTIPRIQPAYALPPRVDYCLRTGRGYSTARPDYYQYRVRSAPQYPTYREWDYWDEDRYGRR